MIDLKNIIASMKGISGSGPVLPSVVEKSIDVLRTMEPGDIVGDQKVSAAPVSTDLWYLFYHQNMMKKYYSDVPGTNFDHYDYSAYISDNISFLSYLPGLKPLKALPDLKQQLTANITTDVFNRVLYTEYKNNGIYWINTSFFELRKPGQTFQYGSEGSPGYKSKPGDYVGYIAFPVGQLGVMEVISLFQETDLSGYLFEDIDSLETYHQKPAITDLENKYKPSLQSSPEMFPDMKDSNGGALAGQNHCFGNHLIDSAYLRTDVAWPQQNATNSSGSTARPPVSSQDVELCADNIKDYGEEIAPKIWMRLWIHKDCTFPVPGEFMGILCRPVACPPHVWWFQESSPFLYAGTWMETRNLTSGIVTVVTLEEDRPDGGMGNLYTVDIQGCSVVITSSDFLEYSIGDRVAILKTSTLVIPEKSFSTMQQTFLKASDSTSTIKTEYVIIPVTFYRIKH
jgi:hypothetical protein